MGMSMQQLYSMFREVDALRRDISMKEVELEREREEFRRLFRKFKFALRHNMIEEYERENEEPEEEYEQQTMKLEKPEQTEETVLLDVLEQLDDDIDRAIYASYKGFGGNKGTSELADCLKISYSEVGNRATKMRKRFNIPVLDKYDKSKQLERRNQYVKFIIENSKHYKGEMDDKIVGCLLGLSGSWVCNLRKKMRRDGIGKEFEKK